MAPTNSERVGSALDLLRQGLAPFVERECHARLGPDWARTLGTTRSFNKEDVQFLLRVMVDNWETVFRSVLSREHRTYVHELRATRDAWAHQEAFSTERAYRALDTVHLLLQAVAAAEQALEVDRLKQDLMRQRFDEQARQVQRRASAAPVEGQVSAGLRPWREVATPHQDVQSGRYVQAEFAADLHQVWRGDANEEYGQPGPFFSRTYLTAGLRGLLVNAVKRLHGQQADPIVRMQTNFGGGKTHSLIALYHLASGTPPSKLPGIEQMLAEAGLKPPPPKIARAVLVGTMLEPARSQKKSDGVEVRTIWGELAWQLGGAKSYALVAEADAAGTSPGAALIDLFKRHSPCLILIDEWVTYARQLYGRPDDQPLPAGTFAAQCSFAQALTDAVKRVDGALAVVSVPSSQNEVGGSAGQAALERLGNIIGREEAVWRPADADEGFEIVRRRLFEPVTADMARERDAVVQAFAKLYRSNKGDFPPESGEASYEERMALAYPIHPELFDRLYNDWSALDRFQRTRGVLRLMATVIHDLWSKGDSSLLIMPGTLPMADDEVRAEMTRYLSENWVPIIESDVDGPNALPLRLDQQVATLGRYSAARRVARTVYLGSAPTQEAANRGVDVRRIKLGCVQPGEQPATFGDALRHLASRATYVYNRGDLYWYDTQPTLLKLAEGRSASHVNADMVDDHIRELLRAQSKSRGDFAGVHLATVPGDVADDDRARLVILDTKYPFIRGAENGARETCARILDQRSGGPRLNRNMLVFLVADHAPLETLRQEARMYLAWKSISDDRKSLDLNQSQIEEVDQRIAKTVDGVGLRLFETFCWVLWPSQEAGSSELTWHDAKVAAGDSLPERASRRLATDQVLVSGRYGGELLRRDLDRIPLWDGDHVSIEKVWQYHAQHIYLTRLRDISVLIGSVKDGVESTAWQLHGFAYADEYDEKGGRYVGLVAGRLVDVREGRGLIVKATAAAHQLEAEATAAGVEASPTGEAGTDEGGAGGDGATTTITRTRRFYGKKTLDRVRLSRDFDAVVKEVVQQLERAPGASVEVTVEVNASSDDFDEQVQRTVTENARTLKFESHGFESS